MAKKKKASAPKFRTELISARDLQIGDEVLSDEMDIVSITKVHRTRTGIRADGWRLMYIGGVQSLDPIKLGFDRTGKVFLLSRRPEHRLDLLPRVRHRICVKIVIEVVI